MHSHSLDKMAASTNGDARSYGKFHPKCGRNVTLSENRRIASGIFGLGVLPLAFSNDPIPEGLKFSVKILQNSRSVSPISASSRPHTSDAPSGQMASGVKRNSALYFCDGV